MPVQPSAIGMGRCYVTHAGEVRKVLQIEGQKLVYVARGKMAFPVWDKELRRTTTREAFAAEADREVPCDGGSR